MNLSLLLNTAHHERYEALNAQAHDKSKEVPIYEIMKSPSSMVEFVFTVECLFFVDMSDKHSDFGSPKLQKHTTWLCEFQPLKKVREIEHTLAWFWSSLAIRGSGGGLVWPQIHEIRLCLPNGWYGDTRDFAGLDFQVCLLDSSVVCALIRGACLHWWPINQLVLGKSRPSLGYEGTCGLHYAPKYGAPWLQ